MMNRILAIEEYRGQVGTCRMPFMTFLNAKEKVFLKYLKKHHVTSFTPTEMAEKLNVTNRTVINWSVSLAKNGFLTPNLVKQRVRSYTVTGSEARNNMEL